MNRYPISLAGWMARELAALDVDRVFGLMGDDTAAFIAALPSEGVRYVGTRHEAVAVGMADGHSWATAGLGVCSVTRGGGLLNAMTACHAAVRGRRRLLVITGEGASTPDSRFDYKAVDQAAIAAAIEVAYFSGTDGASAQDAFGAAIASAAVGHPAVLAVREGVFSTPVEWTQPPVIEDVSYDVPPSPDSDAIDRAAQMLARSRRPLILVGRGALTARDDVLRLADRIGAVIGTTLLAKDVFRGHPRDLGVVGGFASDSAVELLADVDCVLALGAAMAPFTTAHGTLFKNATVVRVDRAHDMLDTFRADVSLVCDARTAVTRLAAVAPPSSGWDAESLASLAGPLYDGPNESLPDAMDPRVLAVVLHELLEPSRTIVLDSGRFMTSPGRFMRVTGPDHFRLTVDGGAIGAGLGVSLGVALARGDDHTVLFIGDGGLSMMLGDLETAVRHRAPLTIVVMNDACYGAERVVLENQGLPLDHAILPVVDFAAVAGSLGMRAYSVGDIAHIRQLAPEIVSSDGPLLLDCRISREITAARLRW